MWDTKKISEKSIMKPKVVNEKYHRKGWLDNDKGELISLSPDPQYTCVGHKCNIDIVGSPLELRPYYNFPEGDSE